MPRLSDTMTEGVVAKWHKQIGDSVNEGDLLAEIETDKATMEFEAFPGQEGKLLFIGTGEGETAPVDTVLAILGEDGEDIEALKGGSAAPAQEAEAPATPAPAAPVEEAPAPPPSKGAPSAAAPRSTGAPSRCTRGSGGRGRARPPS